MCSEYQPWTLERALAFLLRFSRYVFWWWVAELSLHFFHGSALRYHPHLVEKQDAWTVAGIGLSLSQFFHLKYVIFYGIPRVFAVEDGITDAPPHPKCIMRIHRYREMWRAFDCGLYEFLKLYIYLPLAAWSTSWSAKLLSSTVVFLYVFLWHGLMRVIALWALCNYVSVTVESMAEALGRAPAYQSLERRWLSPRGVRRFHAVLNSPLFLASILSNFYFLVGEPVTDLCVQRAFFNWPIGTPLVLFFVFSGCQFCMEVRIWDAESKLVHSKIS